MTPKNKVNHIKNWISDYVNSMPKKAQSLVIGISGGIDSSVSSTLSAMTGLKTIVLSMPIKQKSAQHDLSLAHQEWLKKNFSNVEGHTLELDSLFKSFEKEEDDLEEQDQKDGDMSAGEDGEKPGLDDLVDQKDLKEKKKLDKENNKQTYIVLRKIDKHILGLISFSQVLLFKYAHIKVLVTFILVNFYSFGHN